MYVRSRLEIKSRVFFCEVKLSRFGYKSSTSSQFGIILLPSGVELAHQSSSHVYLSSWSTPSSSISTSQKSLSVWSHLSSSSTSPLHSAWRSIQVLSLDWLIDTVKTVSDEAIQGW